MPLPIRRIGIRSPPGEWQRNALFARRRSESPLRGREVPRLSAASASPAPEGGLLRRLWLRRLASASGLPSWRVHPLATCLRRLLPRDEFPGSIPGNIPTEPLWKGNGAAADTTGALGRAAADPEGALFPGAARVCEFPGQHGKLGASSLTGGCPADEQSCRTGSVLWPVGGGSCPPRRPRRTGGCKVPGVTTPPALRRQLRTQMGKPVRRAQHPAGQAPGRIVRCPGSICKDRRQSCQNPPRGSRSRLLAELAREPLAGSVR